MGVAYKAFTVPITHDEGWTVIQYLDASVWDIMMYPDNWPNNHILNTILAKFSAGIFGVHDWSVRLPNLLFFWVYAFGVFRFLKLVLKDRMLLFVPIATLFVLSPYFLDFFGLCRGYGISSALTMLSISYFTSGYALQKSKHIWMAFACALIASYANFTVLLFFAASCLIAALYFVMYRKSWGETLKNWGIQIGVFVGYVWLIATPILKMKNTNQFEFWTSNGFYEETVFSVIHNSLTDSALYSNHEIFAVLVVVITLILWAVGIWKLFQVKSLKSAFQQPLVIVGTLLFVTVGINLLQTNILGDPNLNGRTALFLLPIFLSFVACGIALFPKGNRNWISIAFGSFLMLVTVQHLGMSYRAESFKEWRYDAHTDEVISYLETNGFNQKGVDISVDWLYFNSFAFYGKYHANSHWVLFPIGPDTSTDLNTEFCYVPEEKVAEMTSLFEVVKTFEGGQTLMRRK
ncbi:MAG: hypothetical protein ACFHU9_06025 [Fluviicola sp.]